MDRQPQKRTQVMGFLGNEGGVMAILFAILLPLFVVMAALAIDMGYAYWKRNTIQVDSSASALAGAGILMDDGMYDPVNEVVIYATVDVDGNGEPDEPAGVVILEEALRFAELNLPNQGILYVEDLHAGNWDRDSRVFTSAGIWDAGTRAWMGGPAIFDPATMTFTSTSDPVVPLDAVLAITRRAADGPNTNPLGLFFTAAAGMSSVNINTAAIVTLGARRTNGFNGCLLAMNDTEEDTFKAFGTADIAAFDCDIYVNSDDECALSGNGVPVIEVGDDLNPGMIYVVGESCATNSGVEWNCNLSGEDIADGMTCPMENLAASLQQIDPFEYYERELFKYAGGESHTLQELQDLSCGSQYDATKSDFVGDTSLADYYEGLIGTEDFDSSKHSGVGEFVVDAYVQWELAAGGACSAGEVWATNPNPEGGSPVDECVVPVLYPVDLAYPALHDGTSNPLDGLPIVTGTKVEVKSLGWNWVWDASGDGTGRQEFAMVPGAYCGGLKLKGNGTIVFADGDYVLKGKAAAGKNNGKDEFNLRANTAIEGFNVVFYLADEYIAINWGGTADVALIGRQSALEIPWVDPLNGFLFYADPSNEGPHQFRGTPAGGYQGIMYFPEGDVVFKGTADSGLAQEDGTGICTILIADTLYFNGTTAFNASTDACGLGFDIPPPGVPLVMRIVH